MTYRRQSTCVKESQFKKCATRDRHKFFQKRYLVEDVLRLEIPSQFLNMK